MKLKLAGIIILVNCAAALCVWACLHAFISLGEVLREGKKTTAATAENRTGGGADAASDLRIDRGTLKDNKKFNTKLKSFQDKYHQITAADAPVYLKVPESEFFKSLIDYFFLSHIMSGKEVILDDKAVKDFMKQGILLYSMDKKYPFMKKSIYLDKRHKTYNKPRIKVGTNVIIIFMESLSQFFLREDVHGFKGLTPNIKDMQSRSFSFTNMYNSSFPTLKGLIAALGSSIYLLDESIGGTRIPVPCRFLFLSDILKSLDYTTIHIQAGSERFIGMKNFFMKRQSYDYFYGSESLALKNIDHLSEGFGVNDNTLFDYTVGWLESCNTAKPFLLTISSINMHPPFKVTDRNPHAGENTLLNSLYSSDKAFGKFWEYFKRSKYRNNTVVILTADHAMGNNKDFAAFIKKYDKYVRPFFDVIPCFIYFPGGALAGSTNNTPCVSLDMMPTILDMMDLDLANPFTGLSIFSERMYYSSKLNTSKDVNILFDEKKINEFKKMLGFYLNIYKEDRIVPPGYKIKFN